MFNRRSFVVLTVAWAILSCAPSLAQDKSITVASTTSTQDSGLFGHILPLFKEKTGIDVRVIAQGTGQALDTARRGDADVVFVHAKPQEEKFVADGYGVRRHDVMYNDFVLIGPNSDPAGIAGTKDIVAALTAIKAKQAPFVSRGDRSGTHQAELALWRDAGVDIAENNGPWYREIGQGMAGTLQPLIQYFQQPIDFAHQGYDFIRHVGIDLGSFAAFQGAELLLYPDQRPEAAAQNDDLHQDQEQQQNPGPQREAGFESLDQRQRRR